MRTSPRRLLAGFFAATVAVSAVVLGAALPASADDVPIDTVSGRLLVSVDGAPARPAAGVTIVAYVGAGPEQAWGDTDGDGINDGAFWSRGSTATSDADGRYSLSIPYYAQSFGPKSTQLWVLGQTTGGVAYPLTSSPTFLRSGGGSYERSFVLTGQQTQGLAVSVTGTDGALAPNAVVQVYPASVSTYAQRDADQHRFAWSVETWANTAIATGRTDASGAWAIALPAGDYSVFAFATDTPGIERLVPNAQAVAQVTVGADTVTASLALAPEAVISGTVLNADGSPAVGYCLQTTGWGRGAAFSSAHDWPCVGNDGRFRLVQASENTGAQSLELRVYRDTVDPSQAIGAWNGAEGLAAAGSGTILTVAAGTVIDGIVIRLP